MRAFLLLVSVAMLAPMLLPSALARDDVRVYRCTDSRGQVTLRDSPCEAGQQQQERTMQRPVDGVPAPRPAAAPAPPPPAPPSQVIVVHTPQPMFRCVRPDGSDYTSDSGDGNPRWVPLWTTGYGSGPMRRPRGTRVDVTVDGVGARGRVDVDNRIGPRRPPHRYGYGLAGTWVRDDCRPIPQAEVCRLITSRREVIRQRFFNAQPSERDQLRDEEAAINARLARDCRR